MMLQSWCRRLWRGQAGFLGLVIGAVLLPLEWIYRGVVGLRNRAYDLGVLTSVASPIPVISVGNLAVGGTGKTPFAGWLVTRLAEMGRRPALVTRGYGSDEALLHRLWNPEAIVVVDAQRVRGVALAAERGADVAVLDDAFQHRSVQRDVDIVMVAAEHGVRRALLPRGRLRESVRSLERADAIVMTRKVADGEEAARISAQLPGPGVRAQVLFEAVEWVDLGGGPLSAPAEQRLLAVTSVADPTPFCEVVRTQTSGDTESLAFPDHHEFSKHDVDRIVRAANGRSVVTTEKDAVKLKAFSETLPTTFVLRLRLVWEVGLDPVMGLIGRALEAS